MRHPIGRALALALLCSPASAAIVTADFGDLTVSAVEDFESYTSLAVFDAVEDIAVGRLGERFSNQALTANGAFDVLGTADPAGDLVAGAEGQNLATRSLDGSIRFDGIGPTGERGEGAFAVAFDQPVQAFAVFVYAEGGSFTFDVFGEGGGLIERVVVATPSSPVFRDYITLASDTGRAEITGFSLFNDDRFGAVYDDIAVGRTLAEPPQVPLPPTVALLLAGIGALAGLGWRRRRAA